MGVALQAHVMSLLIRQGKRHFILEKSREDMARFMNTGHSFIGIFMDGDRPGAPERLAAHMLAIYPRHAGETTLGDPALLPCPDPAQATIAGNVLVHEDFRGNGLMHVLLDQWLAFAAADGKTHAVSEVSADNEFSWSVFLEKGFVIYAHGRDPRDGAELVYLQKPLGTQGFAYGSAPGDRAVLRLFDAGGAPDPAAYGQMARLLAQGWHGVSYDRASKSLTLLRCTGPALRPLQNPGRAPINDNGPR